MSRSNDNARAFTDVPAMRTQVPLLVGLMGPSGSGKTFSALRLASGIIRATGGEIFVIDTEARRSLHYADRFKFRHVEFGEPFGPLDYLDAIKHCVNRGAKVVVVDSMSHEHEGPGGILEMHEREMERLSGGDARKAERVNMLAWAKPKAERRRMLNSILQLNCNFIFCFRAKEKLKVVPGKQPEARGFMPIAGEEFVYEMTLNCLLLPAAGGVPTWRSGYEGERAMMKLPEQFRQQFTDSRALDEDTGEALAKWAAGGAAPSRPATTNGNGKSNGVSPELTALAQQLEANGITDRAEKLAWVSKVVGRDMKSPTELTPDEISTCMVAARESEGAQAADF